jgi:hypothetical protein
MSRRDIDDPGKPYEMWTGKWTMDGGLVGFGDSEERQCILARFVAAARQVAFEDGGEDER